MYPAALWSLAGTTHCAAPADLKVKDLLKEIHGILHYGGLDKATYEKYALHILREDMKNLRVYVAVTGLGFLIFGAASMLTDAIWDVNTVLYLLTAAVMVLILTLLHCTYVRAGTRTGWEDALIYLYMAVIYAESIVLTLQHPDLLAVTYIGVTLMLPLLFARRPLGMLLMQVISLAAFCTLVTMYKSAEIASTDVWNAVTFFLVSAASIMVVVPIRIKSIAQTQIIKELSEYDWLTGLKNRTSYEADCEALAGKPLDAMIIYADANGLHELNNSKGHAAGDNMLRTVAAALREQFGKAHTYRIGGDEFVVICPGANPNEIKQRLALTEQSVHTRGYSMSFGCAFPNSPTEGLDAVIKRAEAAMYLSKADYYRAAGERQGRK